MNLGSLAGQQGSSVNGAHYAASKAGILALTKTVARELAPFGVTVNVVAPAAIDGPLVDALPPDTVSRAHGVDPARPAGARRGGRRADRLPRLGSRPATSPGSTFDINGGSFMR